MSATLAPKIFVARASSGLRHTRKLQDGGVPLALGLEWLHFGSTIPVIVPRLALPIDQLSHIQKELLLLLCVQCLS